MYMYISKWPSTIYLANSNNTILEYLQVTHWIIHCIICNISTSNQYSCGSLAFFPEYSGDLRQLS